MTHTVTTAMLPILGFLALASAGSPNDGINYIKKSVPVHLRKISKNANLYRHGRMNEQTFFKKNPNFKIYNIKKLGFQNI